MESSGSLSSPSTLWIGGRGLGAVRLVPALVPVPTLRGNLELCPGCSVGVALRVVGGAVFAGSRDFTLTGSLRVVLVSGVTSGMGVALLLVGGRLSAVYGEIRLGLG
jgi:hypothetical protein